MNGRIFEIKRFAVHDGSGIRTTVFLKGCNLRCAWCHNPEGLSSDIQEAIYKHKCIGCGECEKKDFKTEDCLGEARVLYGSDISVSELMGEILADKDFYLTSGGGVTFSGGECMLQIDFLEEMLRECKRNGIHTAVDTAGHVPFEYFERIMPYTDLFLYDLKCIDSDRHKKYTGVSNERILENLSRLLSSDKSVWVRVPVIPSVNDTDSDVIAIRDFFKSHGAPERVELLAYHSMGKHKYDALSMEASVFPALSNERMSELEKLICQ